MFKIILIALYILLPLFVIFVERKNPTEAVLWVIILLCIPYVGIILYLAFGSTFSIKLTSYIRKKKLAKRMTIATPKSIEVSDSILSETDKDVIHFNYVYNKAMISCYDSIKVFTNGHDHYESLFNDIRNAKKCIFIEFYTIHNDVVGHKFIEELTKKANDGVHVLVMCDFLANIASPEKMFKPLRKAGGEVIRLKPFLTHFRSHRKIVTIDHDISYIGGMNIGKQYANMHKRKNPWRDTQVRMTGRATSILDSYFMNDWLCGTTNKIFNETIPYLKKIKPLSYKNTDNICQFVIGGVDNDLESVKMCYLSMIRSAKSKICIQSPYFIPDVSILDALKTALATGVEINIMVPGIKASFFLDPVTNYYLGELLKYGAKVYKYNGYIHAKTMIIDSELCCIGSVNMDMRSLQVDDEVCGIFYKKDFALKYTKIYKDDILSSRVYTYQEFMNRSRKEKIMESIFLPLSPLM